MEKPPLVPPSPRGILKTPASRAAKRAAQHASLQAALLQRRPLIFRVLLLGGPCSGKTALLRTAAGERLGPPELSRYTPSLAPHSSMYYAAACHGRAVYLQLWEVPFSLLAADAAAAARGAAGDARFPGCAQLDMLLSAAHAAVLVVDAREGGDARASAVAFPSWAPGGAGAWAGGSLDAADVARGVLARAEVRRAAAVALRCGDGGGGAGQEGGGGWEVGAELRCADAAPPPGAGAAERAPLQAALDSLPPAPHPRLQPWRNPQPHALNVYLLLHKADHCAALAASIAAAAAAATAVGGVAGAPPTPAPSAPPTDARLSGVLENFFGGAGGSSNSSSSGGGCGAQSAWVSSSAAVGPVGGFGVPYLTFRGGGALLPRDVAAYAAGSGLRGWGYGSVLHSLSDAPTASPRTATAAIFAAGGAGSAPFRARAPSLNAFSAAPPTAAEVAAEAAAPPTAEAAPAAAGAAAFLRARLTGRGAGASGGSGGGAGGMRERELSRALAALLGAREGESDDASADAAAAGEGKLAAPAASTPLLLSAVVDDLLERHL